MNLDAGDMDKLGDMVAEVLTLGLRLVIGTLLFATVATLGAFKLIEGYDWSWWTVTSPAWATVGPYLVIIGVAKAVGSARDSMREEVVQHNEFGEGVRR